MAARTQYRKLAGALVWMFFLPCWAWGQITVTENDILALRGQSNMQEDDTTFSVAVNVGSAGANQTWDFRSLVLQSDVSVNQFMAPQGTPYAGDFPQSNFVQKFTFLSDPDFQIYVYYEVSANNLRILGTGLQSPDTSFSTSIGAQNVAPLPVQYGATWSSAQSDTIGDPQTFAIITTTHSSSVVDGWGRIRLLPGDIDCLRVRSNDETITQTIFAGQPFLSDTTTSIEYTWISRNHFLVATAGSQDGETDPQFTDAASFTRLTSLTTSVSSRPGQAESPVSFVLWQNYPNPFNPETQIAFEMNTAGRAELSIFNLAGEKVRTLVSAHLPAGRHAFTWDAKSDAGRELPTGVYLYRLNAGGLEKSKTMLLLK